MNVYDSTEGPVWDRARVRDYIRAITDGGHASYIAAASPADLHALRDALSRGGAMRNVRILRESIAIDAQSRDMEGGAVRDFLELEERALAHLDREFFRELPELEARFSLDPPNRAAS